jgi:TPR repeat protein
MRILIWLLIFVTGVAQAAPPGEMLRAALGHIEAGRNDLARSYLDPLVLDPRLSGTQRSRAYFYRGHAFYVDELWVSALQDYNRALEFDRANSNAQAAAAHMYALGLGVPRDHTLAFQLFLKAARGDHPPSKSYVGYALLTGRGVPRDVEKARFWLSEAADAGDINALLQLARSHRAPFAEEPDPSRAAELYRDAITKGSIEAQVALGYMQLNGELGEVDGKAALERFRAAAANGSASAQTALGYAHLTGQGVAQDYPTARQWYERAAEQQHPAAFLGLGHLYENGLGVATDSKKARELYELAARLGDVSAQLRSAALVLNDGGSPANERAALEWYLSAAEQGAAEGHNGAAWVMSTSRYAELRDGERAVREAERAVALASSAMTLDTLAAAHAERGEFDQAVEMQRAAIAALPEQSDITEELHKHLQAYLRGHPWRE